MASAALIRVRCPNLKCRCVLATPSDTRGKILRCARCGNYVVVPQPRAAAKDAD